MSDNRTQLDRIADCIGCLNQIAFAFLILIATVVFWLFWKGIF